MGPSIAFARGFAVAGAVAVLAVGTARVAPASVIAGSALHFDGANDLVNIADSASLDLSYTATIELWVQPDSSVADRRLHVVNKGDGQTVTSQRSYEVSIGVKSTNFTGEGVNADYFTGQSNGWVTFDAPWTFQPGQWVHLAVTYDATNGSASTYIDGQLARTVTQTAVGDPIQQPILATSLPLLLGQSGVGGEFDGLMDEVRIWNVARSASQIAGSYDRLVDPATAGLVADYHFDEAAGDQHILDATGFGNNGTLGASLTAASDDPLRVASSAPLVPEPASGLLVVASACPILLRRGRKR